MDENGDPTTITVLSDEFLEVSYKLRLYLPVEDITGSFEVDGVTYNWVMRPANYNSRWEVSSWPSSELGTYNILAYEGSSQIGDFTGRPSGRSSYTSIIRNYVYVNNSFERVAEIEWGLDRGNFSDGIGVIYFETYLKTAWQASFDPPIPKNNTEILKIKVKHSWGRKE